MGYTFYSANINNNGISLFMYENQQMHLQLYMSFIIHIYMFRWPSGIILRVYNMMLKVQ
jgi:hypothetical protein